MERVGYVSAVKGDMLDVTFCRETDCEHCHGCLGMQKENVIHIKGDAAVGDYVLVEMSTSSVTAASAIAYVIPLVALIACMYIATLLFPASQDVAGAIGALVGLGASLGILALTEKKRKQNTKWIPRFIKVVPAAEVQEMKGAMNHG